MSKSNAKGLTTLRQKLRKYLRDFEQEMTEYKEVGRQWFGNRPESVCARILFLQEPF